VSDTILKKFGDIKAFAFDMDGVLTDGSIHCDADGELLRTFNIKDEYAIRQALKNKYHVAIISGSHNKGAKKVLEHYNVKDIFMNEPDKLKRLTNWAKRNKIATADILDMGDDVLDIKAMKACGIKACPMDAVQDVVEIADYVSAYGGGRGCVRDVIEKVMKLQKTWLYE
jgi:3-deoxy-D-manno-octulosonate 8-phosphate phosphatase (KDO 8-P phosphatase)